MNSINIIVVRTRSKKPVIPTIPCILQVTAGSPISLLPSLRPGTPCPRVNSCGFADKSREFLTPPATRAVDTCPSPTRRCPSGPFGRSVSGSFASSPPYLGTPDSSSCTSSPGRHMPAKPCVSASVTVPAGKERMEQESGGASIDYHGGSPRWRSAENCTRTRRHELSNF